MTESEGQAVAYLLGITVSSMAETAIGLRFGLHELKSLCLRIGLPERSRSNQLLERPLWGYEI